MFEVMMYDGGVYRSEELYELIDDVGGVVLQKNRSSQMLTVIMSVPEEDREAIERVCNDIGGVVKSVPLAGTEVMGMARGRGKATSQISMTERLTLDEYDGVIFMMGNFKSCVETKAELMRDIHAPTVLVSGPVPEGIEDTCDAIVTGVGRKAARMRTPPERAKLEEIADTMEAVLKDKKRSLEEDPLFVHPAEVKTVLEEYEPINMCLRPSPMVLHLDGIRVKIPYNEHREYLENVEIYGRRLGEIADISPSKIDDSSVLIRIKTRSQVEDEDRRRASA